MIMLRLTEKDEQIRMFHFWMHARLRGPLMDELLKIMMKIYYFIKLNRFSIGYTSRAKGLLL